MDAKWICENPECRAVFSEYINGCPKCYEGNIQAGRLPLHFSVRPILGRSLSERKEDRKP